MVPDAQRILNNTTIWFIPMVNPDGVTLQQFGLKSFPKADHAKIIKMNDGSKNFKRWKANGKGVDLNRQYDARWKYLSGGNVPKFKNYKGKSPESAKETKAVLSFVKKIDPENGNFLSLQWANPFLEIWPNRKPLYKRS